MSSHVTRDRLLSTCVCANIMATPHHKHNSGCLECRLHLVRPWRQPDDVTPDTTSRRMTGLTRCDVKNTTPAEDTIVRSVTSLSKLSSTLMIAFFVHSVPVHPQTDSPAVSLSLPTAWPGQSAPDSVHLTAPAWQTEAVWVRVLWNKSHWAENRLSLALRPIIICTFV